MPVLPVPGAQLPTHPMGQLVGLVELPHLLQYQGHSLRTGQLTVELNAHQVGHAVQQPRHLLQLLACMLHTARPGMVDEEDAAGRGHNVRLLAGTGQREVGGGRGPGLCWDQDSSFLRSGLPGAIVMPSLDSSEPGSGAGAAVHCLCDPEQVPPPLQASQTA